MDESEELGKLRRGEAFDGWDPAVVAHRDVVAQILREAAGAPLSQRTAILTRIFGRVGDGTIIQMPFTCEFGLTIRIGRRCFVNSGATFLDGGGITIGDHVLIGPNAQIYTVGHPLDHLRRRRWETILAPVVIEDDVWIGGNAVIQPGVRIGARSIVGAGSVVTSAVPPDCLVLGVPARVVRSLIAE